jgi:hypothetical protein
VFRSSRCFTPQIWQIRDDPRIDNTEAKCIEYRENFLFHAFLWTESVLWSQISQERWSVSRCKSIMCQQFVFRFF